MLAAAASPASTDASVAALVILLRFVAIGVAGWLALGTAASSARRAVPVLRGWRALDRATLPCVRRALDLLFAAGLGAGLVASGASVGAGAATTGPGVSVVRLGSARAVAASTATTAPGADVPVVRLGTAPAIAPAPASATTVPSAPSGPDVPVVRRPVAVGPPQGPPRAQPPARPPAMAPATPPPAATPRPARPPVSRARHVVAPGENLWVIARAELAARAGGTPAGEQAVARYWARVVATNRPHLRSSNPSLIFPGEVVELPA